ncbi:MAG: NAD(P)/FAD-dependent oxidoreductase [Pseudomonadota bacterium]
MHTAPISRPARYDAVIVGARCAGAATAMLLARAGLRVLAIDRAEYGSDTLSTHALMRGGVASLARWHLLPALKAAGTPAILRTTFTYGDDAVTVPAKDASQALFAPRRTVLDRILANAARTAGAELRFGCTVDSLETDADGRVTGLRYLDRSATRIHVSAGMVIGADGAASRVAEQAGAVTRMSGPSGGATLMGYVGGLRAEDLTGFDWHYRPGSMSGLIPTNDGQACVFVSGQAERFRGAPLAETFRARLRQAAPALADMLRRTEPLGRLRRFGGRPMHLRQAYGPGWALVGDAGCFKDPCTAHGITDAFRDAELLARAVVADGPGSLAGFEATRDALAMPLLAVTERIGRFDWTLGQIQQHLMALGEVMRVEEGVMNRLTAADPLPERAFAEAG